MLKAIRQIFRPTPKLTRMPPVIPDGQRVYAIGDIHGRLDLLNALVEAVEQHDRNLTHAYTTIILLGDLIDRGPESAGVIAAARQLQARRNVRIIAGNHEEMFLQCFDNLEILYHFLRYGGRETLESYLDGSEPLDDLSLEATQALMRQAVPAADLDFLRGLETSVAIGDYLFVHAGIRPGVPLSDQTTRDLRWIREPFLSHTRYHGWCVVHGHTISEEPEFHENRIGIDTGAYMSGRLTALGFEGSTRWIIEASDANGGVSTSLREAA